jgi:hypothetical protein
LGKPQMIIFLMTSWAKQSSLNTFSDCKDCLLSLNAGCASLR